MTKSLKHVAQSLTDEIMQKATQLKALGFDVSEICDNVKDINCVLVEQNEIL